MTTDIELLVAMCDVRGGGRECDQSAGGTLKARCPAKQLGDQLGARSVQTYMQHSEISVTAAESAEIQDGDLVVQPFMERSIDAGLGDVAWRVVGRGEPYEAGGELHHNGVPVGSPVQSRQPGPRVGRAPRGRYVTLLLAPGLVDFEDVEELWRGERRVKAGRERQIPRRYRPENADLFPDTARAVGHDPEVARAGTA